MGKLHNCMKLQIDRQIYMQRNKGGNFGNLEEFELWVKQLIGARKLIPC